MRKINIHPLTKPEAKPDGKTVYVEIQKQCLHSERENRQFGSWKENYLSKVEFITKNKPDTWGFYAQIVPEDVYSAERVYLVCVTYSSGDSFGYSTGNLDVYRILSDKKEAIDLAARIKTEGKQFKHPKNEFPTWCGYFEQIEDVTVFETEYV